ncbi:hypothetical protein RI129_004936 [Pyrocoelia pectoralis]|uniref:CRAL-TRIO domain-containing protein n=1 Tax=Pyrocoelia pectoralis TaxID=417401 RepID=A0AAN7ZJV1_9COLE
MTIRPICKELQEVVIEELNEATERIEEDLQHLREWLQKQPHLITRLDDQWLTTFLRGCKWSLQKSKEKLDYFYTIRTLLPEIFRNRDPFDPLLQQMLGKGTFYPLPKPFGSDGSRIFFWDFTCFDFETTTVALIFKQLFMSLDMMLWDDDNLIISGIVIMINARTLPINFILQFTPTIMKKVLLCLQDAYPIRIQRIIVINADEPLEKVYNTIVKPFAGKKLKERIHMYSVANTENAYNYIPKSFFPVEHGGDNGTCHKASEQWNKKMESKRKWFLDDSKYKNDECLRAGKPRSSDDEFGMVGSFKKLSFD